MKIFTNELANYKITLASFPGWHQHLRSVFSDCYQHQRVKSRYNANNFTKWNCKYEKGFRSSWSQQKWYWKTAGISEKPRTRENRAEFDQLIVEEGQVHKDENKIQASKNNDLTQIIKRCPWGNQSPRITIFFIKWSSLWSCYKKQSKNVMPCCHSILSEKSLHKATSAWVILC